MITFNPFANQLQLINPSLLLGNVDLDLPAGGIPTGASIILNGMVGINRYIITYVFTRLEIAMTGAGSVTARVGLNPGTDVILLDATYTNVTPLGTIVGDLLLQLGSAMNPASGFICPVDAGQQIHLTLTPVGVVTGGRLRMYGFGMALR